MREKRHNHLHAWLGIDYRLRGEAVCRKVDAVQRGHGRKREGWRFALSVHSVGRKLPVHHHRAQYGNIVLPNRVSLRETALHLQVLPHLWFLQERTAPNSGEVARRRWTDSGSERGSGSGKQGAFSRVW